MLIVFESWYEESLIRDFTYFLAECQITGAYFPWEQES